MLDTGQGVSLLTLVEIVGPILLAAALIYGIFHYRRRGQNLQADAGTRRVYASEEHRREREDLA